MKFPDWHLKKTNRYCDSRIPLIAERIIQIKIPAYPYPSTGIPANDWQKKYFFPLSIPKAILIVKFWCNLKFLCCIKFYRTDLAAFETWFFINYSLQTMFWYFIKMQPTPEKGSKCGPHTNYFKFSWKKLTSLSKGMMSVRSYKSVCTASGMSNSSLLLPFNLAKASLLK